MRRTLVGGAIGKATSVAQSTPKGDSQPCRRIDSRIGVIDSVISRIRSRSLSHTGQQPIKSASKHC